MRSIVLASVALLCVAVVASADPTCAAADRHPIVFFPGIFGSRLDEKFDIPDTVPMPHKKCPRQSDWSPAWVEWAKIIPTSKFDCLSNRMRMYPNDAGDQWFDTPGTQFKVPNWGTVKSVDPLSVELGNVIRMYGSTMDRLKDRGYEDGKTLLVASFDWRKMPTDEWMSNVKELIENAVAATGKKAVVFSHSMGCAMSYMFLMAQTAEWRQQYIQHYIPTSPVWIGTNIIPFAMITNKLKVLNITLLNLTQLGSLFRYMEGAYILSPSVFYNEDTLIAKTDIHTYTAKNFSLLLDRVGVKNGDALAHNVQEKLFKYKFEHPGVPVTTFWSTGMKAIGPFRWSKDSLVGHQEPIPELIDGDGLVPIESMTFAYKIWSTGPYASITEGIPLPGTNHGTVPHNDQTIEHVFKAACDSA